MREKSVISIGARGRAEAARRASRDDSKTRGDARAAHADSTSASTSDDAHVARRVGARRGVDAARGARRFERSRARGDGARALKRRAFTAARGRV